MPQVFPHEIVVAYEEDYMIVKGETDEDINTDDADEDDAEETDEDSGTSDGDADDSDEDIGNTVCIHPTMYYGVRTSTKHTCSAPNNFLNINTITVRVLVNNCGSPEFHQSIRLIIGQ
jgi:hypothetical protein